MPKSSYNKKVFRQFTKFSLTHQLSLMGENVYEDNEDEENKKIRNNLIDENEMKKVEEGLNNLNY